MAGYYLLLLILLINIILPSIQDSFPMNSATKLWGSKTTFRDAFKKFKHFYELQEEKVDGKPLMFFYFGRHTIRYPDQLQISWMNTQLPVILKDFLANYNPKKSILTAKDVKKLSKWRPTFDINKAKLSSKSGLKEIKKIAKIYIEKYPNLFNPQLSSLKVGVSDSIRTHETAEAFLEKVDDYHEGEFQVPVCVDKTAYAYRFCKKNLKKAIPHQTEVEVFMDANKTLSDNITLSVSQKLNLKRKLSFEEVRLIYLACAFEVAIREKSPWCLFFDKNEINTFEYLQEVAYLTKNYGYLYNRNASCTIINRLINTIKSTIASPEKSQTVLLFSHSGAIIRLWNALGLFFQLRPFTDNYKNDNKFLRASLVDSFGSQFAATLLQTDNGYKLLTFVQGHPVKIGGCSSNPCSIEEFFNTYTKLVDNCILSKICPSVNDTPQPCSNYDGIISDSDSDSD